MPSVERTEEQMNAFLAMDIEGPIHMLNLLKFKPNGGRKSYAKYSDNTFPLIQKCGGKVVYHAVGKAAVIGDEQWDTIIIVEYPSRDAYLDMVQCDAYKAGKHLRTEALDDSRLVCMQASG